MISVIVPISPLEGEGLEPYRTLILPPGHRRGGLFVAEGSLVVKRFPESRLGAIVLYEAMR
ncbi:MAG: hypothetical protein JW768_00850 [Chitinispirillaceae bacterium]|nr:hypothetical protein [Chitinispirillaceae bacterium]